MSAGLRARIAALEATGGVRFRRMFVCGHSWGAGSQLSNASRRFASILAVRYGCEDVNAAISGAVFSAGDTVANPGIGAKPGGHQTINRVCKPARGLPFADLNLLVQGYNDLGIREPIAPTLTALKHSYRFAIARMRAGAVIPESDARWSYSAGWTANVVTDGTSANGTNRSATAQNEVATLTLAAADFNGARADVCVIVQASGPAPVVTATLDGTLADTVNLQELTNGDAISNSGVLRIRNVPAGAHTIAVTVGAGGGTAYVNGALIGAPDPPVVALTTHFLPVASRAYTSAIHTPVTQADVAALNAVIRAAAAEWDARVPVVALDTALTVAMFADDAASGFARDDLHPNPAGHEAIAAAVALAVERFPAVQCCEPQVGKPLLIGDRNMPAFSAGWSNTATANYPTLRFQKNGGRVRLWGNIKKATAGAAGEVIITLPIGFRPATVQALTGLATGNVLGWGRVDIDGTLRWSGGDPTGFWGVDLTFDADGA